MSARESKRAEEVSDERLFQRAPVRTTLAAVAFVNWFLFFAVTISLGGDAIGTTPSTQGFVVKKGARITRVSERVWVFSLVYPLATLCLTPVAWMLLGATQFHRLKGRGERIAVVMFVLIWCTGWYYAMARDGGRSIQDYCSMKAR